ncbi:hypothetical protein SAE02_75150 [Skermanella aerolata]|uniref:Uncharacterized protein n=1 Tax=Skermanella aerolata TaxID=393310 RepID=A0A512E3T2_9PROT|nr:hypothetical protein N826_31305 [Skermanella aerolata KACC 11604]GEO43367.1 hypothetical protein SAE02_75150 [Skermanella aerolata]
MISLLLVNRRINKSQQMHWSRHDVDLLLQVRCAVLNGKFGPGFGQLFDTNPAPERLWQLALNSAAVPSITMVSAQAMILQ